MRSRLFRPALACFAVLLLSACSDDPVTPGGGSFPGPSHGGDVAIFPLEVGNRWDYTGFVSVVITPDEGLPETHVFPRTETWQVKGVEEFMGRSYWQVEKATTEDGDVFYRTEQWRQTSGGLYSLEGVEPVAVTDGPVGPDVVSRLPVAEQSAWLRAWDRITTKRERLAAAVGLLARAGDDRLPGEATILDYPLRRGHSWAIRPDWTATVDGKDLIEVGDDVFTGWRIRIDFVHFNETDVVHVWYGEEGMLLLEAHLTGEATNESGEHIGFAESDEALVLDGVDIAQRSRVPDAFR